MGQKIAGSILFLHPSLTHTLHLLDSHLSHLHPLRTVDLESENVQYVFSVTEVPVHIGCPPLF